MAADIKSSYDKLSDIELIQLIAKDDDNRACSILMKHYNESLRYELLKMVNNKSDAEYLTLQGFAKAFINIDQYDPEFTFSTWLFAVAKNNCIDFLRKKQKNIISIDEYRKDAKGIKIELSSTGLNPEDQLIKKQRIRLLYKTISKLDPPYRSVIKLFYFEELSLKEMSERLNLPINTLKVHLHRARNELYRLYNIK